jgi:hypothetical protein
MRNRLDALERIAANRLDAIARADQRRHHRRLVAFLRSDAEACIELDRLLTACERRTPPGVKRDGNINPELLDAGELATLASITRRFEASTKGPT